MQCDLVSAVGQDLPLISLELKEGQTTPPDYLSESELISLMEKHGIGTDASISTHINNICQRNYVHVTVLYSALHHSLISNHAHLCSSILTGHSTTDSNKIGNRFGPWLPTN